MAGEGPTAAFQWEILDPMAVMTVFDFTSLLLWPVFLFVCSVGFCFGFCP